MRGAQGKAVLGAMLIGIVCIGGCKKQQSDADGIRAGIRQHLTSLSTLNLNAMEMDIRTVSIQGNQAVAQVTFRPKTDAPAGTGMEVSYQLEKRDAIWVVTKTGAIGGGITHPEPGANPHVQPGQTPTPGHPSNFQDMLIPASPGTTTSPPPGHPPVRSKPRQD